MSLWGAILLAVSLCADCFAVSLCSSVTVRRIDWKNVTLISLSFAVIQAGLLFAGWGLGELLHGFVGHAARVLAFLLLVLVGVSMLCEGISGRQEVRNLDSFRNVLLGGLATSIDAALVGAAQSIAGLQWKGFVPLFAAVFAVTAVSVVLGILGGSRIGARFGRSSEIAGGVVLILIALWNLFR
ncbi:MAG: manganese efflux pump [Bacteroidales bacterium]|nr:manganese efflux pump [Bacteroidales bacterium]